MQAAWARFLLWTFPLLIGCSTVKIVPSPGQQIGYTQGMGYVRSTGTSSEIAMGGVGTSATSSNRLVFAISFKNEGRLPVDFGVENVQATDAHGKRLRIYTADELEREARTRAVIQGIAIGLNAGSQAFAAAQPAQTHYSGAYYGNSTYNAYNRIGQPVGSIQGHQSGAVYGSATTYNPAQQALASQAIQANAAGQMQGVQNRLYDALGFASSVIARTTVQPGQIYSGLLVVKRSKTMDFLANIAGDEHRSRFEVE